MKKQTLVGTKLFGECEDCGGTALQIQDEGMLKGMIRLCPKCGRDWKSFKSQYGTDEGDGHPDVYIDAAQGILSKVDKRKPDIIKLKDGSEIEFRERDPIAEKLNNKI